MRLKLIFTLLVICGLSGCTSFKTTSLYRKSGHKMAPQNTNAPLKGLPVKMKVPSHVNVVVYEQQLILAADTDERKLLDTAVQTAASELDATKNEIKRLSAAINTLTVNIESLKARESYLKNERDNTTDKNEIEAINDLFKETVTSLKNKEVEKQKLVLAKPADEAKLKIKQRLQESALAVAKANQNPGYRLVSFNPPQYIVESEIQYTDKVFLVDFKRPAGGVLDLTSAKMDDEQYFAQVKAEVEERTIEDISSVLASFTPKPRTPPEAKPTSANTPEAEANSQVHFQKSVVAMKRFDISQCGWEQQMTDFVNGKLQGNGETISESTLSYEVHMPNLHGKMREN